MVIISIAAIQHMSHRPTLINTESSGQFMLRRESKVLRVTTRFAICRRSNVSSQVERVMRRDTEIHEVDSCRRPCGSPNELRWVYGIEHAYKFHHPILGLCTVARVRYCKGVIDISTKSF